MAAHTVAADGLAAPMAAAGRVAPAAAAALCAAGPRPGRAAAAATARLAANAEVAGRNPLGTSMRSPPNIRKAPIASGRLTCRARCRFTGMMQLMPGCFRCVQKIHFERESEWIARRAASKRFAASSRESCPRSRLCPLPRLPRTAVKEAPGQRPGASGSASRISNASIRAAGTGRLAMAAVTATTGLPPSW